MSLGIAFAKLNLLNIVSRAASGIPVPESGMFRVFLDSTSLKLSAKNSSGTVINPVEVVRYPIIRIIEKATDWPADGTTSVGGDIPIPFTGTIVGIFADVDTAGTTGTAVVDVNKNGTTIMSTDKLKWDSTEKSTRTYSGTAPGITTTSVTAGDIITVDIDTNHTTKSKGLTLTLAILPS